MAEVSRGREVFGRLLAALGVAWVFWGFLGPVIGLEFGTALVDVPILPGIVILFIGRALSRGNRRSQDMKTRQDTQTETPVPPRPESRARTASMPEKPNREPLLVTEPVSVSDVTIEALEPPELDLPAAEDTAIRKTSAEMVAEARKRYGKRP